MGENICISICDKGLLPRKYRDHDNEEQFNSKIDKNRQFLLKDNTNYW